MVRSKAYKLWYHAIYNAKQRNVEFLFEFDDWVKWWEAELGPDWIDKRGHYRNQFVMARNGDKGPYHPNNVHLATASQNSSERKSNGTSRCGGNKGENNPRCKLTKAEVIEIFQSLLPDKKIADYYKISFSTVRDIKKRKTWKSITSNLESSIGKRKIGSKYQDLIG